MLLVPLFALLASTTAQLVVQPDVWDDLHHDDEFAFTVPSWRDHASDPASLFDGSCPANPPPSCPTSANVDANSCCINTPGSYFTLTQFWDATPRPVGPVDSWTLHGLWPDYCSEDPKNWPSNCDSSRMYNRAGQLREILKDETELVAYMDKLWIPDAGSAESFWEHEWNKHGTCVSTLNPKCYPNYQLHEEVVTFFKTAVDLFKGLPTHDFLADHGIVPSVTQDYTLAQLQNAAKDHFGHEASWGCKRSSKGWELNQVFWGHVTVGPIRENPVFVRTRPGTSAVNTCPETGIKYFPKDGTAPRPGPPGPPAERAFVKVVLRGVETGCLISTGRWLVTGTCAGYSILSGSTRGEFTLKTSKGPCSVSTRGVLTCGGGLKPTTFNLDVDGNLNLLSSASFYAASIPTGRDQVPIITEKTPNPVQLHYALNQ